LPFIVKKISVAVHNELIIDSSPSEVVIALLHDRRLIELHREKRNNSFSVGDIYLGRVKKIMPGLNAAFIDVGYEKDAFLHYLDLGPQFASLSSFIQKTLAGKQKDAMLQHFQTEADIDKSGKITQVLNANLPVLVQIAKEPISTKGPRISSEISLAGRYLVLVPFSDRISVSQKIKNPEEKDRLKKLLMGIRPKHFGVIIRTVAENQKISDIENDLADLLKKWGELFEQLKISAPPKKILGELDRTSAILRDILNASFQSIHVNDQGLYDELKTYLQSIAPDKVGIVKLYNGKVPIFDQFGVERQIKSSFGKTVNLKSGSYLIIEHTEAMHVIDVNSGNRGKAEGNQEDSALEVNLEAATEVARQLRLRDMGGIIVVDFIDLLSQDNRKILYDKIKDEMSLDRAKHQILPPTKFGLVQITRQRVRPEMNVITVEKCPACHGKGEVESTVLLNEEIENKLRYILKEQNQKKITLSTNPYLGAYFTKGIFSKQVAWYLKYKKWISVKSNDSFHLLEYRFIDEHNEEIKL
jgi:ribonuclease G